MARLNGIRRGAWLVLRVGALLLAVAALLASASAQSELQPSVDPNVQPLAQPAADARRVGTVQGIPVFSEPAQSTSARPKTEIVPGDGQFLQATPSARRP